MITLTPTSTSTTRDRAADSKGGLAQVHNIPMATVALAGRTMRAGGEPSAAKLGRPRDILGSGAVQNLFHLPFVSVRWSLILSRLGPRRSKPLRPPPHPYVPFERLSKSRWGETGERGAAGAPPPPSCSLGSSDTFQALNFPPLILPDGGARHLGRGEWGRVKKSAHTCTAALLAELT